MKQLRDINNVLKWNNFDVFNCADDSYNIMYMFINLTANTKGCLLLLKLSYPIFLQLNIFLLQLSLNHRNAYIHRLYFKTDEVF